MEEAVSAGATTTDEWGMTHKVQHQEQLLSINIAVQQLVLDDAIR